MTEARDPRRPFRQGLCDGMAVALARRSGLPTGLWRGFMADGGQEDCHACAVVSFDPPRWIDVDGLHEGIPDNAAFSRRPREVRLVEATADEVMEAFCTFADTAAASVEAAEIHLQEDGELAALADSFRSAPSGPRRACGA